jgi:hypothetical protein
VRVIFEVARGCPVANWSRVRLVPDDNPQLLLDREFLASARQLDLRRGILLTDLSYSAHAGITIRRRRTAPRVTGGAGGGPYWRRSGPWCRGLSN